MTMSEELRRRTNTYLKPFRLSRSEARELLEEIDALEAKLAEARSLLLEVVFGATPRIGPTCAACGNPTYPEGSERERPILFDDKTYHGICVESLIR